MKQEPKNESGGRGRERHHPFPALLLVPFFARSLTLVPRSLLLKRTETLVTQASCTNTRVFAFQVCNGFPILFFFTITERFFGR